MRIQRIVWVDVTSRLLGNVYGEWIGKSRKGSADVGGADELLYDYHTVQRSAAQVGLAVSPYHPRRKPKGR